MDARLASLQQLASRPGDAYVRSGAWGQRPIWERVRDQVQCSPRKPAVVDAAACWNYDELWRQAQRYADAIAASGVGARDIVLTQLPNWREYAALVLACELTRTVFAFCPIQWGLRETSNALSLLRPRLWFTTSRPRPGDDRSELIASACAAVASRPALVLFRSPALAQAEGVDDWVARAPSGRVEREGGRGQDPLEIAVTSGTTGDPKGVLHVHDSALATVGSTITRQRITDRDVIHLAIPVGHTFGYFYGVRCALQAGGTLVLQERWDAHEMLALVRAHGITVSLGPSAFVLDLLALAPDELQALNGMHLFTHSGDSLPGPTARRARSTLPFRISRAFGMTEFGHSTATDADTPAEAAVDSLGTPQPEMELKIVDDVGNARPVRSEGRILVRGPFLFAGYLARDRIDEQVLDRDGFFDTGDLGYVDEAGHLYITGRVKLVIRRGAETIPVGLLEDVIAELPQVAHVVVVGMPHERFGEEPVACIQLRPGASLDFATLTAALEAKGVTKKFWPVRIEPIDRWPIGPTGKIDRRMVAQQIAVRPENR
jgi:acyl-CoA synthetase (AMP-forming)/AMP-acid ligase II